MQLNLRPLWVPILKSKIQIVPIQVDQPIEDKINQVITMTEQDEVI